MMNYLQMTARLNSISLTSRALKRTSPAGLKRGMHPLLGLLLVLLATGSFTGCDRGESAAFSEARELERKVLMQGGEINYAHADYLRVARLLNDVPPWSSDYARAQEKLKQISDARRLRAGEIYQLDYKPASLEGVALSSLAPEQLDRNRPPATKPTPTAPAPAPAMKTGESGLGQRAAPAAEGSDASRAEPKAAPVVMYATSWCGYCRRARSYFQTKKIPYVEHDIERDPAAARELARKIGPNSGVPVIDIDGTIIHGFDVSAIEAALARRSSRG